MREADLGEHEPSLLTRLRRRYVKPWRTAECAGIQVAYKRYLDGGGSSFGQEFGPWLRRRGMPKQARAFEWCAGPAFIGFSLLGEGLCARLTLADINPDAVTAMRRTVRRNALGDAVSIYRSDNLRDIPRSERWDLVVSNPPHFADAYAGQIKEHDADWDLHRQFFQQVRAYLNPGAVIVLQENNRGSTAETFRPMIEDAGLRIVFVDGCAPVRTPDHRFYFLGIMRREDPAPLWASSPLTAPAPVSD